MHNPEDAQNFSPKNRRLLIDSIEVEEKTESGVLLPTDYGQTKNKHTVAKILSVSADCTSFNTFDKNFYVVVDTHMIETIKIAGSSFETILENYVVGTLEL